MNKANVRDSGLRNINFSPSASPRCQARSMLRLGPGTSPALPGRPGFCPDATDGPFSCKWTKIKLKSKIPNS